MTCTLRNTIKMAKIVGQYMLFKNMTSINNDDNKCRSSCKFPN